MTPSDNTGLGLFDETASAAGNFPGALRGYDRQAVDDYVRTLEASVVQARRHAGSLEQQVTSLQDQLSDTRSKQAPASDVDYSDLGGHANDILRLAQEQATDLTNAATIEAEKLREQARRETEALREKAASDNDDLRTGGLNDIEQLRRTLQQQVDAEVARAQAEAATLVEAARREGDAIRRLADHDAQTVRQSAQVDADVLRREVEREVADARAELAHEQEEAVTALRSAHDEASARTTALLTEATEHHTLSTARLEADIAEAARIRAEAVAHAEEVKSSADVEAEARLATARKQAAAISERTQQEFSWRKQQLRRDTDLLQQRKQAVLSQLASLSALAEQTASSFPDLDESDAAGTSSREGEHEDVGEDGRDLTVLKTSEVPAGTQQAAEPNAQTGKQPGDDEVAESLDVPVDGDPTVLVKPGEVPAGTDGLKSPRR